MTRENVELNKFADRITVLTRDVTRPDLFGVDALAAGAADRVLMNPPFKGAVDKGDVHPSLPSDTTKSELLFLHLILRALDIFIDQRNQGERAALGNRADGDNRETFSEAGQNERAGLP